MNETDLENFSIIKDIVEKAFSLSDKSLSFFKDFLDSGENIAPEFLSILGPDRRKKVNVSLKNIEPFDSGWEIFSHVFQDFIEENKIEYSHFNSNIFDGKKLFKAIISSSIGKEEYYGRRYCDKYTLPYHAFVKYIKEEDIVQNILKTIGTKKLPKSNSFEIIMTANFADWFLCSTGESWGSCIGLDSSYDSAYWSGLPGLVGDKNRIMIYLTDGSKKDYLDIKVDKVIARSFGFLTEEGFIYTLKNYPVNLLSPFFMEHCFSNFKFYPFSNDSKVKYISKYPITPLYFNEGSGCFIFNDNSEFFKKADGSLYISSKGGGYSVYNEEGTLCEDSPAFYSSGLTNLLRNEEQISDHFEEFFTCQECGVAMSSEECFHMDDGIYCEECYIKTNSREY